MFGKSQENTHTPEKFMWTDVKRERKDSERGYGQLTRLVSFGADR